MIIFKPINSPPKESLISLCIAPADDRVIPLANKQVKSESNGHDDHCFKGLIYACTDRPWGWL